MTKWYQLMYVTRVLEEIPKRFSEFVEMKVIRAWFRECIRFWNGANIIYAYWQHMRIFGIKGLKDYIIIILTVTTHHLQSHWRPASIRFRSYAKIACINWHRELNEYHRILVRIRIKGLKREWTITWVISSRRHEQTTGQNVKIIMLI